MEDPKKVAAMHLLQLRCHPIAATKQRPFTGLVGGENPTNSADKTVEGQFDDAPEPPLMSTLRPMHVHPSHSVQYRASNSMSTIHHASSDTKTAHFPHQSLFEQLQSGLRLQQALPPHRSTLKPVGTHVVLPRKHQPRRPLPSAQKQNVSRKTANKRHFRVNRVIPKLAAGARRAITPDPAEASPFRVIVKEHPSKLLLVPQSDVDLPKQLPMQQFVPLHDIRKQHPVLESDVKNTDVMLGRGSSIQRHAGNVFFRELISHYRVAYCTAPKGNKGQLARNICNYIRLSGGRFLERDTDGRWYECGDERATAKCSQAMREGTAGMVRKMLQKNIAYNEGMDCKRKKTKELREVVKKQRSDSKTHVSEDSAEVWG
jgi:hypothetical protein